MSKMDVDYDHILNIDYDSKYKIGLTDYNSLIYSYSRQSETLDGQWNFAVDVFDTGIRKKFFDEITEDEDGLPIPVDFSFDEWEKVNVPGNWNVEKPEYFYYEGSAWYTRKFDFAGKDDERIFLKIGGANNECRVWLNKKLIARHIGGYTPIFVEVTEYLRKQNRILIMVNNTRNMDSVPSINFDWFNYGGLYRSVELIRVPNTFIKDFFIHLIPDGKYKNISAKVKIEGIVEESICSLEIPELNIREEILIDNETGTGEVEFEAPVSLWSPENPKLYKVLVKYGHDIIEDNIGFREIKVDGTRILLNGRDIYLKGVCAHEDSVLNARALTEDEMLETINLAKEMNCNFIRLAHYPHSEKAALLADRLGIMLWEEIPVYWALEFKNENTFKNASNQLRELILRDRNRASVIIWSVGNENPDTDDRLEFMRRLSNIAKGLDPTRLISAACLVNIDELRIKDRLTQYVDIVGINEYYGWYYRDFSKLTSICDNSNIGKPVVVSETGGEAVPGYHGSCEELYTEECQKKIYEEQFKIIGNVDYIRGIIPWILFDYRTPVRMNKYQKGYNLKGLVSMDKKHKKLAFHTVKEFYKNK